MNTFDNLNTKLNSILTEFKKFDENSFKVISAIPNFEFWRFFMELDAQELDESCRELLKDEYFTPFLDLKFCDLSKEQMEILFERYKTEFKTDWQFNKDLHSDLTLREFLTRQCGWIPFERRQPGYFTALFYAFNEILRDLCNDQQDELNFEFIKTLHEKALRDVKNTNYGTEKPGELRTSKENFELTTQNVSLDGFTQLLAKLAFKKGFEAEIFIYDEHDKFSEILNINHINLVNIKDEAKRLYNSFISNYNSSHLVLGLKSEFRSKRLEQTNFYIARYNHEIKIAKTPLEILKIIKNLIQSIQQVIHPFRDGNTRTLNLLLNFLLIQNGFPPAILKDANRFEGYSEKELLNDMIEGMALTLKLAQHTYSFQSTTESIYNHASYQEKRLLDHFIHSGISIKQTILANLRDNNTNLFADRKRIPEDLSVTNQLKRRK